MEGLPGPQHLVEPQNTEGFEMVPVLWLCKERLPDNTLLYTLVPIGVRNG